MALSKRSVYVLLVATSGLLYFLYTISSSADIYNFTQRIRGVHVIPLINKETDLAHRAPLRKTSSIDSRNLLLNTSSPVIIQKGEPPSPDVNSAKKIVAGLEAVATEPEKANAKRNGTASQVIVPEKKTDKAKKEQIQNVISNISVIQRIPPKVDNRTVDFIVQGVTTKTLYDAGFILPNTELCPDLGKNLKVAILITSAPKHGPSRIAIRQTWGHYQQRKDIAIGFLIGRTPDADLPAIREEANLYGDIIQANFMDSYNNLTLKTISLLEWVENYCSEVKFVLKTDDDMFINVPKLITFVAKHAKDRRKIYGRLAKKWKPIRNKTSKYYVSLQQYKYPVFPDFTTGPAYAMTTDIVHDLYIAALTKTYLKLEDVYTTGIVAMDKKIQRVHVNEFFNRRVPLSACNIQKGISIHMVKPFEQYDLWKKLLDGRSKC